MRQPAQPTCVAGTSSRTPRILFESKRVDGINRLLIAGTPVRRSPSAASSRQCTGPSLCLQTAPKSAVAHQSFGSTGDPVEFLCHSGCGWTQTPPLPAAPSAMPSSIARLVELDCLHRNRLSSDDGVEHGCDVSGTIGNVASNFLGRPAGGIDPSPNGTTPSDRGQPKGPSCGPGDEQLASSPTVTPPSGRVLVQPFARSARATTGDPQRRLHPLSRCRCVALRPAARRGNSCVHRPAGWCGR